MTNTQNNFPSTFTHGQICADNLEARHEIFSAATNLEVVDRFLQRLQGRVFVQLVFAQQLNEVIHRLLVGGEFRQQRPDLQQQLHTARVQSAAKTRARISVEAARHYVINVT